MGDEHPVNILLVDDREDGLDTLEIVLSAPGYNLIKARSGTEALRKLLTDDYCVILLDVSMPEMTGFEVASLIRQRERTKQTPIIFLTAMYKEATAEAEAYELGAVDFITKPYVPGILKAKVNVFVELFR